MQLTSSAVSIRFSLNRDAAPEKVNATIKPNRAKTAPSTVPRPLRSPSDSFGRRRTPKRRPISIRTSMPTKRIKAKSSAGMGGSMGGAPFANPLYGLDFSGLRSGKTLANRILSREGIVHKELAFLPVECSRQGEQTLGISSENPHA